jgi:NADPH:quinone reductase-like Zn-dependent oxidoreductase
MHGGETLQKLLGHIKPGGTIGSAVGESAEAKARGLTVRPMMTHVDPKRLAELTLAVAEGKLVIPIEKRFPLAEGRAAQLFAETESHGKVLLVG